jgi:hypothetical protein
MINSKFIIINGKLFNATYISSIRKISDDINQEYIIRVEYVINNSYDDVYYDSAYKRDNDYNRILVELTNN